MSIQPYGSSPVFDENSLPEALRNKHSTKSHTWGRLNVLSGSVKLVYHEPAREIIVTPDAAAPLLPEQPHHVEVIGPVKMRVDFYHQDPDA
ncbi:MAG: DUF1971 domain-containing protein [Sphingomonadaceae bacterium]